MGNLKNINPATQWTSSDYCATGKVRQINEDSIMANDSEQLWVVADGMGGHQNGDYASQHVTSALGVFRRSSGAATDVSKIDHLLHQCNIHLVEKAQQEQKDVIGCTVAALLLHEQLAWCIWSGDSRIYRLRDAQLSLLTRDHNLASLGTAEELAGEQFSAFTNGEVLTSAIGGDETLQTEQCCYRVQPGDEFLLCTDGLYKEIPEDEIGQVLAVADNAVKPIDRLSELYLARGARDNVGMIHIYRDEPGHETRTAQSASPV